MRYKKIYISGKITGTNLDVTRKIFNAVEVYLIGLGYDVVNPFKNGLSQDESWEKHMKVDLGNLSNCDSIFLLPTWKDSRGARLEYTTAKEENKEIIECSVELYYNIYKKNIIENINP